MQHNIVNYVFIKRSSPVNRKKLNDVKGWRVIENVNTALKGTAYNIWLPLTLPSQFSIFNSTSHSPLV
jgi:hypothetical protein